MAAPTYCETAPTTKSSGTDQAGTAVAARRDPSPARTCYGPSRFDDIDDAARELLAGTSATLRAQGKAGYLVDSQEIVVQKESVHEAVRFATVDDAIAAAELKPAIENVSRAGSGRRCRRGPSSSRELRRRDDGSRSRCSWSAVRCRHWEPR